MRTSSIGDNASKAPTIAGIHVNTFPFGFKTM
ncbi:MAG: hypothetical protein ACI88G_001527 [Woeseiaceae bacterium]|jgi:hypothetical protein